MGGKNQNGGQIRFNNYEEMEVNGFLQELQSDMSGFCYLVCEFVGKYYGDINVICSFFFKYQAIMNAKTTTKIAVILFVTCLATLDATLPKTP